MTLTDIQFLPELPAHDAQIEEINAEAFGPGRFTRAAYKIREGGPHDATLSFVATCNDQVIGSVRMTAIAAGTGRAMLLGPLAVRPDYKSRGIGRKLVYMAIDAAKTAGHDAVMLVGDEPYYGPLGFKKLPYGQVSMPRPTDPNRMLLAEITPGTSQRLQGMITHAALSAR